MRTIEGEIYLPVAIMNTPGGQQFADWLIENGRTDWAGSLRAGHSVRVGDGNNKLWEIIRDRILSAGAWPIPRRVNGQVVEDNNRPYFRYNPRPAE